MSAQTMGVRRPSAAATTSAVEELARLEPAEAALWRRRLTHTARPCGCKSGAAAVLLALAGNVVWRAVSGLPGRPAPAALAVLSSFALVVAAGVAGKLAGIAVGRYRHRRLRRLLVRRLHALGSGG